ncbi:Hypothetical_protein [Hexamita inflata]|uniref:Hypothetical_protein n=1 Tax=Hexamita inflata TaxID=28002 RepID=A0ABP1GGL2_9EUKA
MKHILLKTEINNTINSITKLKQFLYQQNDTVYDQISEISKSVTKLGQLQNISKPVIEKFKLMSSVISQQNAQINKLKQEAASQKNALQRDCDNSQLQCVKLHVADQFKHFNSSFDNTISKVNMLTQLLLVETHKSGDKVSQLEKKIAEQFKVQNNLNQQLVSSQLQNQHRSLLSQQQVLKIQLLSTEVLTSFDSNSVQIFRALTSLDHKLQNTQRQFLLYKSIQHNSQLINTKFQQVQNEPLKPQINIQDLKQLELNAEVDETNFYRIQGKLQTLSASLESSQSKLIQIQNKLQKGNPGEQFALISTFVQKFSSNQNDFNADWLNKFSQLEARCVQLEKKMNEIK